jgi:hypothetical protein
MKRLFIGLLALSLVGAWSASAWAGYNYIQYQQEFKADQGASSSQAETPKFQHKNPYQRQTEAGQGTMLPTSGKPGSVQKYERPDWAK